MSCASASAWHDITHNMVSEEAHTRMGLIRSLNEQDKQGVDAQPPASTLSSKLSCAFRSLSVSAFSSAECACFGFAAQHLPRKLAFFLTDMRGLLIAGIVPADQRGTTTHSEREERLL